MKHWHRWRILIILFSYWVGRVSLCVVLWYFSCVQRAKRKNLVTAFTDTYRHSSSLSFIINLIELERKTILALFFLKCHYRVNNSVRRRRKKERKTREKEEVKLNSPSHPVSSLWLISVSLAFSFFFILLLLVPQVNEKVPKSNCHSCRRKAERRKKRRPM